MAYLAQLRAEHAATLLLHSDQPVTSISQAVGWPDQNYFARRFKAHYGLSATTYRARFAAGADRLRFQRLSGTKPAGRRRGHSRPSPEPVLSLARARRTEAQPGRSVTTAGRLHAGAPLTHVRQREIYFV